MNFKKVAKTSYHDIPVEEYFDGACPECRSLILKIRSSYKRLLPDIGAPREKRFLRIKINYFECETCGHSFSPKHPDFPSKLEYAPSIILYALERYFRDTYTSTGRDVIGKKKPVVSLSLTKQKNGGYLLTLSEMSY